MPMTIVVSIGRGVTEGTLDHRTWSRFKDLTWNLMHDYGDVVFHGEGVGVYEEQTEDAYTVIATSKKWREADAAELRIRLGALASCYRQDCIALTITAATEFVAAR